MASKGDMKINGKDAWEEWELSLADGSVTALLTLPGIKPLVSNMSRLKNGKSVVRQDSNNKSLKRVSDRDVSLIFNLYADSYTEMFEKLEDILNELNKGETILEIVYLPGIKFHLDYISCTQFSQFRGTLAKFIFKFNEPDPTHRI